MYVKNKIVIKLLKVVINFKGKALNKILKL